MKFATSTSTSNHPSPRRSGATMTELVVSAAMVAALMSFVTSTCFRVSQVSKDVTHHRVAVAELANQLDRLTALEPERLEKEIEKLEASDDCKRTLLDAKLEGKLSKTEIGTQVNLRINWIRQYPGSPVELVGWVPEK